MSCSLPESAAQTNHKSLSSANIHDALQMIVPGTVRSAVIGCPVDRPAVGADAFASPKSSSFALGAADAPPRKRNTWPGLTNTIRFAPT